MSKAIYYFTIMIILFSSCSLVVKKIAGLKDPKVETKESIASYLGGIDCPFEYCYVLKGNQDSTIIFNNIMLSFNDEALLFDSLGVKHCYFGKEKCSGTQLTTAFQAFNENYKPCIRDTIGFKNFLSKIKLININLNSLNSVEADYYIVMYWSKFFGTKKRFKEDLKWLNSLQKETEYNIIILLVNTDLQKEWGLKQGKKMKLKFKFLGNKSGSLEFGNIPYDKKRINRKSP